MRERPEFNVDSLGQPFEDLLSKAIEEGDPAVFSLLWDLAKFNKPIEQLVFKAVDDGHSWLAKFLLDKGADAQRVDGHGWTLGWIAFSDMPKGGGESALHFVGQPASCDFKSPTEWDEGGTSEYIEFLPGDDREGARLRVRFGQDDELNTRKFLFLFLWHVSVC